MTNYSLIEHKLRLFVFLGNKTSTYVPSLNLTPFWEHKYGQDFKITGIKLIENIIIKNKTEDINSIIPIISKIEKEKNLQHYKYLIYLLAVCAKFNLKNNCQQMMTDANEMVLTICTDGLKLFMFYKFCNIVNKILFERGHIPTESSGFSRTIRLTIQKWYLNRVALETIKSIMNHMSYDGINHKQIMYTIHLHSDDPSHVIYITYILYGIKKMIKVFEPKLLIKDNDCERQKISKIQQRWVYDYIITMHSLLYSTNYQLTNDLKLNSVGKDYEIVAAVPKVITLQPEQNLSTDLMKITLDSLNPSSYRLLIAYDSRNYMNSLICNYKHTKFLKAVEAVTLIIQSIIYPNQLKANSIPTICALSNTHKFKIIDIDYEKVLATSSLKNNLFRQSLKDHKETTQVQNIKPLSTLDWSMNCNQMYDVFLFMGTNNMDLKNIKKAKKEYEAYFSNTKIKIIICCLKGYYSEQNNFSRDGMFFISGFDENIGELIELFINNIF